MPEATMLEKVKNSLGITGNYQDDTLTEYIDEVVAFLKDAGVTESNITSGVVARGVSDLWNYGAGNATLSDFFRLRLLQLRIQIINESGDHDGGGI